MQKYYTKSCILNRAVSHTKGQMFVPEVWKIWLFHLKHRYTYSMSVVVKLHEVERRQLGENVQKHSSRSNNFKKLRNTVLNERCQPQKTTCCMSSFSRESKLIWQKKDWCCPGPRLPGKGLTSKGYGRICEVMEYFIWCWLQL